MVGTYKQTCLEEAAELDGRRLQADFVVAFQSVILKVGRL